MAASVSKRTIQHEAPKGSALTLDEVAAFVQDAMRFGATGAEVVGVTATWGAKIRRLTLDVESGKTIPSTGV